MKDLLTRSRARKSLTPAFTRGVRIGAQLSQAEIAEALGVDVSTVCKWENGERTPRGLLAERYAELLEKLHRG